MDMALGKYAPKTVDGCSGDCVSTDLLSASGVYEGCSTVFCVSVLAAVSLRAMPLRLPRID